MNVLVTATADFDTRKWLKRAGVFCLWLLLIKGTLGLAAPLVFYWML